MHSGLTDGFEHDSSFDGYRLKRSTPLGSGNAGDVYLATPLEPKPFANPGDLLAIKRYKPEILKEPNQLERIQLEFQTGSTIDSPYMVRIYDFSTEGRPYLVMEFVDGVPLLSWVGMFHPVAPALAFRFVDHLTEALGSLHAVGGIHRDVKPSNVVITYDFRAKLMDLGVVRFEDTPSLTDSDDFVGTKRNAAPEFLHGKDYDNRIDLYSLGTVIFTLLHGIEVFADESNAAQLAELVAHAEPAFDDSVAGPSEVGRSLFDLCKRLLAKNPNDRPSSIDEVRESLESLRDAEELRTAVEPLQAYIGTALTNLDGLQRDGIDFVSKRIADIAKQDGIYVYQPRRATDPILHEEIEPQIVHMLDRYKVEHADVVFFLLNERSFGVGQEIEIASAAGKPIILIHREEMKISRMVTGTLGHVLDRVSYQSPEELDERLRDSLRRHMDSIRTSHLLFRTPVAAIGERLRTARIAKNYHSADAFAREFGLPPRLVEAVEAGEFENVPFALVLRWCRALGSTVTELLAGDLSVVPPEDAHQASNLRLLEDVADKAQWLASDYFALRTDYIREFAARGRSRQLEAGEWVERHRALEKRRLQTGEQSVIPLQDEQT
jgi:transcriptional regulator with XRE-family HTH domain